jgi:4-diphosphocytidyl-2-C-methyl-D-erythritol kinase
MNRLFHTGLSMRTLMEMGEKLGSDIPYCLLGGTCLATGRGEKVQRIEAMPQAYVALVKPDFGISTPWSYAHFDPAKAERRPQTESMRAAIRSRDLTRIGAEMVNLLERAALEEYPVLADIRKDLAAYGAEGVLMSGSGPTVYGLFSDKGEAIRAVRACRAKYPRTYTVVGCSLFQPRKKHR